MKLLAAICCALSLLLPVSQSSAADFPVAGRPIRILVGFPPGGGTDTQARLIAQHLQDELGTTVIVVNRPGASTMLASLEVMRSAPDGYTLLYTPSGFVQIPHTLATVQYDPFKDFTPVSLGALGPIVLVANKSVPATNVKELVAYAKAHPNKLNYASFGVGTSSHIFAEMLVRQAGIDMVHIPYKGANDVLRDLTSGQVQLQFASASAAMQLMQSGSVRMLGVASSRRTSLLPDVPTMTEQGIKDIDIDSWIGFFGPANMPPAVVTKLNAAIVKVLAIKQVQDDIRRGATEPASSTPAQFGAIVRKSYDQWGALVKELGMTKQTSTD